MDLFKEIAERLDFDYDFYETKDGYFGSLNDDGTWNGAIHELIEKVRSKQFEIHELNERVRRKTSKVMNYMKR